MKIFAIADLHLALDERIDKPMDIFGAGWEDHAERLQENWDRLVGADDVVLVPGDLSWGMKLEEAMADLEWIHRRAGRKLLIKGNHDLWWSSVTRLNELYGDMHFIQNDSAYIETLDTAVAGTRGWPTPGSDEYSAHDEKIYRREAMRLENSLRSAMQYGAKRLIVMMHYPPADDRNRSSLFIDVLESYPVDLCVYGHLHGQIAYGKGIRGAHHGIEYRLVSLDYLGAVPKLLVDDTDEMPSEL